MSYSREMLRKEAKKLYKEQTKGVPKSQRVPFSQFFKHYRDLKHGKITDDLNIDEQLNEDFDFDNLVNINEISDDDIEIVDSTEEENDS